MSSKPIVISAPQPRSLDLIFRPEQRSVLHARYEVVEVEADTMAALPDEVLACTTHIIGQPPVDAALLARLAGLRCVFNVESNLVDNMPYETLFARGIHVVTTGAVFAVPVAEIGLGFALDLARGISGNDAEFRTGRERWGGAGNAGARLLSGSDIGLIGYGDLGRALHRLLAGFGPRLRVFDPWLPDSLLHERGLEPAPLPVVLAQSDTVFVVAGVTAENRGFLGAEGFATMRRGAALILLSRADVVDFEALLDAVAAGQIVAASDVWPQEPLPPGHRARTMTGLLRSAHRAGALDAAFLRMGDMVLEDMALIDRGLPPLVCKRAERETVSRMRSRPVSVN